MPTPFEAFMMEAPASFLAWGAFADRVAATRTLDAKTAALVAVAVAAATQRGPVVAMTARAARAAGAHRQELIDAVLVGVPLVGLAAAMNLVVALEAFEG